MSAAQIIIIVLQLLFGSGILLYLIRLSFLIGKHVEQVDTLKTSFAELKQDLRDMEALRVLVAKLEVTVESFRVDLNHFRERRLADVSDRRSPL